MTAAVIEQIRATGFAPDERPRGLFRIASRNGLAEVCLVDYCLEPAVLMEGYTGRVLFVIANDRDLLFRFGGRADVFRLVDLVLGKAGRHFRHRLREIVRADKPHVPPAITTLAPLPLLPMARTRHSEERVDAPWAPPGTKWNQIEFYYIDGETLALRIPGKDVRRITPHDLDLIDRRGRSANDQWRLLVEVCEGDKVARWSGCTEKEWRARVERASKLRKKLQAKFGIHDSPIDKHDRQTGLRVRFQAFSYAPGARDRARAIDQSEIDRQTHALEKNLSAVRSAVTPPKEGSSGRHGR